VGFEPTNIVGTIIFSAIVHHFQSLFGCFYRAVAVVPNGGGELGVLGVLMERVNMEGSGSRDRRLTDAVRLRRRRNGKQDKERFWAEAEPRL